MSVKSLCKLLHSTISHKVKWFNSVSCNYTSLQKGHVQQNSKVKSFHTPVMLKEAVECLYTKPNSVILDMTFGAGGHSKEFLSRYKDCHVLGADRDERAFKIAESLSKTCRRVTPILGKFSELDTLLDNLGYVEGSIDGVLIDAGCSSMQFDEADRGFSLSRDGPLDMRMDGNRDSSQVTAADVVNHLSFEDLTRIILKYGEEHKAEMIAQCIVENRPYSRTRQLAQVVSHAISDYSVGSHSRTDSLGRRCHAATKTFMALRIFVNDEMNELNAGIECAEKYLRHEGRLVCISFHSLEDRVIKKCLRKVIHLDKDGNNSNGRKPKGYKLRKPWTVEKDLFCCPSEEEVVLNPRSRSAFMRTASRNRTT